MTTVTIVLNGSILGKASNSSALTKLTEKIPSHSRIVNYQRNSGRITLHIISTVSVSKLKLNRLRSCIQNSPVESSYFFGTRNSDLDLVVFFPESISRSRFLSNTADLINSISNVWPSNRIFSLSRFSSRKPSTHGFLHLLVYRGVSELKELEAPLLLEAIAMTGERISGQELPSATFGPGNSDILKSLHYHRNELSLAIIDCLSAHDGVRRRLLARSCEYHSRHLLVSLIRSASPPSRELYERATLALRLLLWKPRLGESYLTILFASYDNQPDTKGITQASERILSCVDTLVRGDVL